MRRVATDRRRNGLFPGAAGQLPMNAWTQESTLVSTNYRGFGREGIRFAHLLSIVRLADGDAVPAPQAVSAAGSGFRH
jgi:hypothetical protein